MCASRKSPPPVNTLAWFGPEMGRKVDRDGGSERVPCCGV